MTRQSFEDAANEGRKLKYVKVDSNGYFEGDRVGYQKIDDVTVAERKQIPLNDEVSAYLIYVYDFNTKIMATIIEQNDDIKTTELTPFAKVDKQAIIDAHRALSSKKLRGTPPSLDEVFPNDPLFGKRGLNGLVSKLPR